MRRSSLSIAATSLSLTGWLDASAQPEPTAVRQATVRPPALDVDRICAPCLSGRIGETKVSQPMHSPVAPMAAPPPPPPAPLRHATPSTAVVPEARFRSPSTDAATSVARMGGAPLSGSPVDRERYGDNEVAGVRSVTADPVSTFGVDVDTGAHANVRRLLTAGRMPPRDAVRTEELLNYFRCDDPAPADRVVPFTVSNDVAVTPWNPDTRLLRIGLHGYDVAHAERPPANLVFLVDVSGSMGARDKLPLVQCALAVTAERLRPDDRVSVVAYAGAAGLVLPPTSDKRAVLAAIERMQAGGSTAGEAGLRLAYATANANKRDGAINRVLLATDGDLNVGVTNDETLTELVEREAKGGVTLTTLGFGTGSYNEAMMEQIADHGNGNHAYLDSVAEVAKVLDDELSSTLFTIAKHVKMQVEFNPGVISQCRLIGYENRALKEEDFANDAVDAGDIGAGHQVTALHEVVPAGAKGWLPERAFAANRPAAAASTGGRAYVLKLRYKLPGEDRSRLIEVDTPPAALARAGRPKGAFAAAVAAYGQKLRGDPLLANYDRAAVTGLAGRPDNPLRRQFTDLIRMAASLNTKA